MLTPTHDELANGDLAGLGQGSGHDGIALVRLVTVWHEILGLLPITTIDVVLIDELLHVDGVLGFELEVINLFRVD